MAHATEYAGYVGIDDDLGPYPALIDDVRWNGWASPRFHHDTVIQIVHDVTASDGKADPSDRTIFTWDGDVLVIDKVVYRDQDGYTPERLEPDADGMYALGAWSWTWSDHVLNHEVSMAGAIMAAEADHVEGLIDEKAYSAVYDACEVVFGGTFVEYCASQNSRMSGEEFADLARDNHELIELVIGWRQKVRNGLPLELL